ncbi:MAG: diguanylate cyclase [Chloroflexota bacterium]
MGEHSQRNSHAPALFLTVLVVAGAIWSGTVAPALTHTILGLLSISLLVGIFMFAWHTRAFITSDYFLMLGIGSLAVALLHALHLVSYPSFDLIKGGAETAPRSLEAAGLFLGISLLFAPTFLEKRLRSMPTLIACLTLCTGAIVAILLIRDPLLYTASGKPTAFNTATDAVAAAILIIGILRLRTHGAKLNSKVLSTVTAGVYAAIVAQIAFTLEFLAPEFSGLVGHVALAFALYLFFRAVVETGLTQPYSVLFHDLKQTEASVREMSLQDELTGLLNRRGFFSLAEQQMRISMRTEHNMLLFYCDLDAMKAINDSLGHREGDRALADVAQMLRETFRESDMIARFGGDEFVVLAIETDETSVAILRDRLERRVSDFNESAGRPYNLRLSIGVATYDPRCTETLDEVLSRADSQMYRHKQARNV